MQQNTNQNPYLKGNSQKSALRLLVNAATCVFLLLVIAASVAYDFALRPAYMPVPVSISIEPGQGASSIARELQAHGVVRSASVTQVLLTALGGTKKIHAGVYLFKNPENAIQIAFRLVRADLGYVPVRLTVPEGTNSRDLAELIGEKFLYGNAGTTSVASIERQAKAKEGYLFPETYFFASFTDPAKIIQKMSDTFSEKTNPLREQIQAGGRSLDDVIKVASILEKEVQTKDDKRMVADIIWRRIQKGMALQVDSTLGYVLHKTSAELTVADLKSDSAFNTYAHKGLPPTPISNPGLESIQAAIDPIQNQYFFYLSDKDGITHFAKTYDEHLRNKKKYIK